MKLSCPACGAAFSLDVLLGHEGARDSVMAALRLPAPLGKLLIQYIGLFRPASRNLSFDRVASLLNEMQPMIEAGLIERNGRPWSAPQDYWRMALDDMLAKRDKLTLPLKNHGYLLTIIAGLSGKAEAAVESKIEAQRAGHTPVGGNASVQPACGQDIRAPDKPRSRMPDEMLKKYAPKISKGENDGNS
jgi:hypothetical protein